LIEALGVLANIVTLVWSDITTLALLYIIAFSAKLRDETDIDTLDDDVRVVKETMQPAYVSMWLHPTPAWRGEGRNLLTPLLTSLRALHAETLATTSKGTGLNRLFLQCPATSRNKSRRIAAPEEAASSSPVWGST
jgi:hypothetical protein